MTLADRPDLPAASGGGRRISCLLLLFVLVLGGVAAGAWLLQRAKLRFTNLLAAPVQLVLGGGEPTMVAPGRTVTLAVPRGQTLVAEWSMVRPLSADGQPMGEPIAGSLVLRGPRGTVTDSADTVEGATNYFAPLVTNASDVALRVKVNAGLAGAVDCGCAVRAGGRRVFIGYYRLYANSTVEARGGPGVAAFRDLGPQVTSRDGSIGLRFEAKDLRPAGRRE